MDTKLFKMLNDSLAYATFSDSDVEKQYKRLLIVSDSELNEAGFEESIAIEDAMEDLKLAIEDADPIEEDDDEDNEEDNDEDEDEDDENDDEHEDEDDEDED